MELRVEIAVVLIVKKAPLLVARDDLEPIELFRGAPARGKLGNGRFHNATVFVHIVKDHAFGVHGFNDGVPQGSHVRLTDVGAVAVATIEKPFFRQRADGLANAAARNAE